MKKFSDIIKNFDIVDSFFIVGILLISYGLFSIYQPLCFIFLGIICSWIALKL